MPSDNTTIRLDYDETDIRLFSDSPVVDDIRSRSCEKEPETVAWIEKYISLGDVLYDIGANVGAYSLIAGKRSAIVYAFEPAFMTYDSLVRNVLENKVETNVFPFPLMIGTDTCLSPFRYRDLVIGGAEHNGPTALYAQPQLVCSLDFLIFSCRFKSPTHIKIDVDGPELNVLQGAMRLLRRQTVDTMMVELNKSNHDSIVGFLSEVGYDLRQEYPHTSGKAFHDPNVMNALFLRK